MPVRVPWEDQYALSYRTTAIGSSDAATSGLFTAAEDGIAAIGASGECGFLIDEHPNINPGVEIPTTEKTTGLSQKQTTAAAGAGVELMVARKLPTLSVGAMGMTEEKLDVLLWSLFQKGVTEATTPFPKTCIPYVQGMPEPEMFLDISRSMGDPAVGAVGHLLAGAICTQVILSGAQGERFTLGAEFIGRTYRSDYDHTGTVFTSEATADHSFLNYTWTLDGSAASLQSFDLTVANNAVPTYYGTLVPSGYTLHRMGVSGTFGLAMSTSTVGDNTQIDNFVVGTDILLVGTFTAVNVITLNAHYTGPEIDPAETELLVSLPYEGVYDGTNQAIKFVVTSGIDRSIPA